MDTHIVCSDGCSDGAQFKSIATWYFVSCYPCLVVYPKMPSGVKMVWNFLPTVMGKGGVDGARALV